ncbi:MAG: peptidyl-prolyl cis-trans isomerase [Candidatus Krumholzibacteriia bacterium]
MTSARISMIVLALTAAFIGGCSSQSEQAQGGADEAELAAKVDAWTFTREELQEALDALPENKRREYDTPGGRAELTDKAIEQELYFREGLKLGLKEDEELREKIKNYERAMIINAYFERHLKPLAYPAEEELYEYYEAHHDRFTTLPIRRAQHIFSKDREKLVDFKKRIAAGEPMTTLAHKYSEDDLTRDFGGDLGYFNPGGYIRGIGYSDEISDVVFSLDKGVVSEPINWKKGYSLIRVTEIRPAVLKPFEDVREEIAGEFVLRKLDDTSAAVFTELKKNYDVTNYLENEFNLTQRTPEELWNLAQTSSDSYHRLRHYQEIVDKFPKSPHAPKAIFMIGFVNAEELKNTVDADRAFNRVINEYPESEVANSARWMLKNLNRPLPQFESLDELNEKISDESN